VVIILAVLGAFTGCAGSEAESTRTESCSAITADIKQITAGLSASRPAIQNFMSDPEAAGAALDKVNQTVLKARSKVSDSALAESLDRLAAALTDLAAEFRAFKVGAMSSDRVRTDSADFQNAIGDLTSACGAP
jgi:hypothetical protein